MTERVKAVLGDDFAGVLILGLCPAIAVSSRVIDSLWMSAGVLLVTVLTGLAMHVLARGGPYEEGPAVVFDRMLPALLVSSVVTAGFEAALLAVAPTASSSLGIYAPLIAVNCLVHNRRVPALAVSSLGKSAAMAAVRGVGFAACLVLIALVRESLGAGTVTLLPAGGFSGTIVIPRLSDEPVRALGFAGGGLLCLGYVAGAARIIARRAADGRSPGEPSR